MRILFCFCRRQIVIICRISELNLEVSRSLDFHMLVQVQGFAGIILFPQPPPTHFTAAVQMSFLNFWFGIAGMPQHVPWCTTANLAVRRTRLRFEDRFPKTGGGEDVHFCLQLEKWPMRPAPNAVVTHPWWKNGKRDYPRFFGWARGK